MARSLKTRGIIEIRNLKSRVRRQHALNRISQSDCDWLVSALDAVEAKIVEMHEVGWDFD